MGVEGAVAIVRVVEQVGVQEMAEKEALAPLGRPAAEKETDCEVPETRVAVMVFVTEEPRVTDLSPPFAREKSNGAVTVKSLALSAKPSGVVTLILPVVAPPGTVVSIRVSETTVKEVATVPLKATWVAPVKFVPVMVTAVPTGPLVGVNDVIVGGVAPELPFSMVKWSGADPLLVRNLASS